MICVLPLVTFEHTADTRQMANDVRLALGRAGLTLDQAARWMDMTPQQLDAQMAGRGHLSLYRLVSLPAAFWIEFIKIIAPRFALIVLGNDLAALVTAVRALTGHQQRRKAS